MAHPSHKIAGPLLRDYDRETKKKITPATPEQMLDALTFPKAWVPAVVADEWVNEARRKNGMKSTSAIAGEIFRTEQELRKRPKAKAVPIRPSRLQRIASRITRLFRKH